MGDLINTSDAPGLSQPESADTFLRAAAWTSAVSVPGRFTGTERYELVRRVGEGGFGVVYEALDHEQGGRVALKVLRVARAAGLYHFKREFRALAGLIHPNLVRLYELISKEKNWFFTMELIEGKPLLDYLAAAPERLRPTLRQLVEGLHALHGAGKLHRDVKPSNVMVDASGRAVLLDFGLAIELSPDQSHELAGTPLYMSPEQCAQKPLSEASDWYALGVMLFQALTGELPFQGTVLQMLTAKQTVDVVAPSTLAPGIPPDLDALCVALLSRDPAARPSGSEILQRLSGVSPSRQVAPPPTAALAPRQPFIGRETELAALWASFEDTLRGRRTVSLLHGPSGIGKSALLRRFLSEVRERHPDTVILSGRCYERESVPYKALDPIVDELARYLRRLPEREAEALAPRDGKALQQLFPVLRHVPALQRSGELDRALQPAERKSRGMAALRELLARLADRRRVIICVDDLQWGDVDSAALLAELARPPDPPALCFVGSYRTEEVTTSPLLQRLGQLRSSTLSQVPICELSLGQLERPDARQLAVRLLSELGLDAARADGIAEESGGSPFFVQELVRSSEGREAGLHDLVQRRVERAEDTVRRLLEVIAVVGRPVPEEVAARAAGVGPGLRDALQTLRADHLVRGREIEGKKLLEPYHDRVREAVVRGLEAGRRRELHTAVAEALEHFGITERADAEALSAHWREAGDRERAASYAIVAAVQASETLAFERAAKLYRLALELRPVIGAEGRALHVRLGDALTNAGRGPEAAEIYRVAAVGAPPLEAIDLERRAAEELLRSGHLDQGAAVLRSLLALANLRSFRTARRALASLVWHRARIRLRGLAYRRRDAADVPRKALIRIDMSYVASIGLAIVEPTRAAEYQARNLLLALAAGEPHRVGRALNAEACFTALPGRRGQARSLTLFDQAEAIGRELDDRQLLGRVSLGRGLGAFLCGKWKEARTRFEEGEAYVRQHCTGMTWELDAAQVFLMEALYFLGELDQLAINAPLRLRDAEERGDLYAAVGLRSGAAALVPLIRDDAEAARREASEAISHWSASGFHVQHFYDLTAQINIDLYGGPGDAAAKRFAARLPEVKRSLLMRCQNLRIKRFDLEARAALAAAMAGADRPAAQRLVLRNANRIEREGVVWATPLANLLRAGAARLGDDAATAMSFCTVAAAGFVAADMLLHAQVALRGEGRAMGDELGRALAERAEAWMAERHVRAPERFATMLAPSL